MKRILSFSLFVVSALSLASCKSPPPPEIHNHYYVREREPDRYYYIKPAASVSTYSKSANVGGGSPESFEAVTPPSSYSR